MLLVITTTYIYSKMLFEGMVCFMVTGVFFEFCKMIHAKYKNQYLLKILWVSIASLYASIPAIATLYILNKGAFIYLLALVIATDVGGYVFGSKIGGYKIAPLISPKKTWSGTIGGIISGTIVAYQINDRIGIPFAIILCIASVIGDLLESGIKRHFQVKDSGSIFPGHGGFMDRADSILVTSVVLAIIIHFNTGAF